jgi:hypothetical protein
VTFGFPNPKNNSFRGNYMRKYGISGILINPCHLQRCFFPRKTKKQITKARSEKKATKVVSLKKASNFHQMRINGETTNSDKKL